MVFSYILWFKHFRELSRGDRLSPEGERAQRSSERKIWTLALSPVGIEDRSGGTTT
jgi:hypothetical protein